MAEIELADDRLTVRFTRGQKVLGIIGDFTTPRSTVSEAHLVESWRREVRGWRVGLGWPGRRLLGTWRSHGHRQLVDLSRDVPAVRIVLTGATYDELLLSTPDAERLVRELMPSR